MPRHPFRLAAALAVAFVVACSAGSEPTAGGLIAEGRVAWASADFLEAIARFERARELAPGDPAPVLGIARSNHELHLYGEAIAAYELYLERVPDDRLAWEGLIGALTWGGILEGNGARIERAIELAPRAIAVAPDGVELYDQLHFAAAELNRRDEHEPILAALAEENPGSRIIGIELARIRLSAARRRADTATAADDARATVERLEIELRARLDDLSASSLTDAGAPPSLHYELAMGYQLLGAPDRREVALTLLEASPEGRRLATLLRYSQFLEEWTAASRADASTRVQLAESWLPRFAPTWETGITRHRTIQEMQFDVLVADETARAASDADLREPAAARARRLDRIAALGDRLARADTWNGASRYVETARVLAGAESHASTAIEIADDGIAALESERPGLFFPGRRDRSHEAEKLRHLATLHQLKGQALHTLGRDAEAAIREAIALRPVAGSFAVLGGLLLEQGRDAEALDVLVAALAHGFAPGEGALQDETRAAATEAARRVGRPIEIIDDAVAFAVERLAAERDREIVADALDLPAPGFELVDREGGLWRLDALAGKVVVLNYWATWCAPCEAEFPHYETLVDEYAGHGDVVFLAISTDSDPEVVGPWIDERGFDFTVLYDAGSANDYQVSGIPASFLIDKEGTIRYRTSGFPGAERYLHEMRLRIEALRKNP